MKTILTVAAVLVVGFGLMWWGKANQAALPTEADNSQKSALAAEETFYDFGTISMKNGLVNKEFTVKNPTGRDVNLKTIVTSCMCTTAFLVRPDGSTRGPFGMPGHISVPPANETIKAGESRIVRAVFDPNAHGPAGVGQIDRIVTLTDSGGGTLELQIKALVTP